MTAALSIDAYEDCVEILNLAAESERGLRIKFATWREAKYLTLRMNQARTILRKTSYQIYNKGDPMYGKTPYDIFTIRVHKENGAFWTYVSPRPLPEGIEYL